MFKLFSTLLIVLSFTCFAESESSFVKIKTQLEATAKASKNPEIRLIMADYRLFPLNEQEFKTILKSYKKIIDLDSTEIFEVTPKLFLDEMVKAYNFLYVRDQDDNFKGLVNVLKEAFSQNEITSFHAGSVIDGRFWAETIDQYFFSVSTKEGSFVFMIKGYL